MEQRKKPRRYIIKRIKKTPYFLFYIYLLFVLTSLFSVASYTWFTLSRTPEVSDMNLYITSGSGLELSADPGAAVWTNQLDIYEAEELKEFQGSDKRKPSLRQTTWSDSEDRFFGPLYGYDGRLMPLEGTDYSTMQVVSWYRLEDKINANKLSASSYYLKASIYARCDQPTDVTLTAPMDIDSYGTPGAGTYVIGDPNTGRGPETAVRVGLRMTYVDKAGNELSQQSDMYIYEPNMDRHADGSTDYIPTYAIHDLESQLGPEERLIRQKFSQRDEPGEFESNPVLFSLKPGQIVRIEVYLWLEGQDVDCSNIMAHATDETRILANIQFTGTTENQSGMVPME